MYGPTLPRPDQGECIEFWETPEMAPQFYVEAQYNPAAITGQAAKVKLTALLAEQGIRPAFVTEDHLCTLCCKDLSATSGKVPDEGGRVGTDGKPMMRCEPKCRRTVQDIAAERKAYLDDWAELRERDRKRGTASPAMERFMDEVARQISESHDPAATFDKIRSVITAERMNRKGCPVYSWCKEREPGHVDHSRHDRGVVSHGVVHLSDSTPKLWIGNDEFPVDQAAEKAAELRLIADRLEVWADRT